MNLKYRGHVQNMDWTEYVTDGQVAGTTNLGLRLEALQIEIENKDGLDIRIEAEAHVQNIGWQGLKTDGEIIGTVGLGYRLEAVKIRLTGMDSSKYDILYRVHVENYGWQLWKKNDEIGGLVGQSLRAEAIEIRLVLVEEKVVTVVPEVPYVPIDPSYEIPPEDLLCVGYQTHVQNYGWGDQVNDGRLSGIVGKSLRIEAIRIEILNRGSLDLGVRYQTHVADIGTQAWVSDNATAGTTGIGKQLESIKIELTGTDSGDYSIWYRVHVQNEAWQEWKVDGQTAGTEGLGLRAEAIQILITKSNESLIRKPRLEPLMSVNYRTHIQNQAWTPLVSNGQRSGTTGYGLRMEAIELNLSALDDYDLGIRYMTHIQNYGWDEDWILEGQPSGSQGQSLRIEAIRIELTGLDKSKYTVQYRVHVQNKGWSAWAANGAVAGTEGESLQMEAISVVITKNVLLEGYMPNEIKNVIPIYKIYSIEFPGKEFLMHDIRTDKTLTDIGMNHGEKRVSSLTFNIDPTHEYYNELRDFKSTIMVYEENSNRDDDLVFEGRIVRQTKSFNNVKSIICEGEMAYLLDGIQRPAKYENQNTEQWMTMVLDRHNQAVTRDKRFYMGVCNISDSKTDALRENDYIHTLDLLNGTLVEPLGGHLEIEHRGGFRFLNFVENVGTVNPQPIMFGQNLIDMNEYSNSEQIITALVPIGKTIDEKKLTISTVNGNADYVYNEIGVHQYGWIFGYKEWNEVDDAETLKQLGVEYLDGLLSRGLTLELTALDLSLINMDFQKIKVGDVIRCVSRPHGIDLFLSVVQKQEDLSRPSDGRIVLGDPIKGIVDHMKPSSGETPASGGMTAVQVHEAIATIQNTNVDNLLMSTNVLETAEIVEEQTVYINDLVVKTGEFENLFAGNIDTQHLKAGSITTELLAADIVIAAEIEALSVTTGKLAARAVTADKAEIGLIKAGSLLVEDAAIGTAMIGDAMITTALIEDGAIIDAKIVSLTADKIVAGTIDTSLVTVLGPNGKLRIANNRLQVFDNSTVPKERVSIGDVDGNGTLYGLRVRGADGTTVLFNETGVTPEGITDGTITNVKISGTAEIEGSKLLDNSIAGGKLVIDSITAREIKSKEITASHIKAGTLTSASGIFGTMDANVINAGTISAARLDLTDYATFTNLATQGQTVISGGNIKTGVIISSNFSWNPGTGMLIDINNGMIESKNFKVSTGGDVYMKGTLDLGSTESLKVRDTNGNLQGEITYVDEPDMLYTLGSLLVKGDSVVRIKAGSSSKQFSSLIVDVGDDYMFGLYKDSINTGVILTAHTAGLRMEKSGSQEPTVTLTSGGTYGMTNGLKIEPSKDPKVSVEGCTKTLLLGTTGLPKGSGVTTYTDRSKSVTLNKAGNFVTINFRIDVQLKSSDLQLCRLPVGFRPTNNVTSIGWLSGLNKTGMVNIDPNGYVNLWEKGTAYDNFVYSVTFYI